jgi:dTDP-4-dehydrorhamnose reductase
MRIIVFGSNGMLGTYLTKVLGEKYSVVSLTRNDIDIAKSSETEILNFLEKNVTKDDIIINSSGIIKQREYEICDMIQVNSQFPNYLSKFKKITGCNIIHITTDCVFNGLKGYYVENNNHDCFDEYGKTKSLGENESITVIRTSIIGEELQNQKSLVEWVKSQSNKNIFGYVNHLWNGVTCLELSKYIDDIISTNNFWVGVRHIFSPTTVSKFELVNMINEIYGLNIQIEPKETDEKCFRNLSTNFTNPIKKELFEQITEMKNFNLK